MTLTLNIVTTLVARIAALGLALISSVMMARWLGPEGRGVFSSSGGPTGAAAFLPTVTGQRG